MPRVNPMRLFTAACGRHGNHSELYEPLSGYHVEKNAIAQGGELLAVTVPLGLVPGDCFQVRLPGNNLITVCVPNGTEPGTMLRVLNTPQRRILIFLPEGVKSGETLACETPDGELVTFTAPTGCRAGQSIKVVVPHQPYTISKSESSADTVLQFTVPESHVPGKMLTVSTPDGRRIAVNVPESAQSGSQLQCVLPAASWPSRSTSAHIEELSTCKESSCCQNTRRLLPPSFPSSFPPVVDSSSRRNYRGFLAAKWARKSPRSDDGVIQIIGTPLLADAAESQAIKGRISLRRAIPTVTMHSTVVDARI
mmetsp:Transcript_46617/g.77065  ORF Transcript_46617/g.77065 Transcript_46617/m.77065 type:complete len:309 (-) Transcript_46617:67-993(-)